MLFKRAKVLKPLVRYFTEVVIIFLGITISFVFEQWREGNRQKEELIELSESLVSEMENIKVKLANDMTGSVSWIKQLDSLRIQRSSNTVSDVQLNWFYEMISGQNFFLFDPSSPTYVSAESRGLLHEYPDTIRAQLYNLYRVQMPLFKLLYDQQQENITNFRNTTWVPSNTYLYQNDPMEVRPDLLVFATEMKRPVYGNFINQVIVTEKTVLEMNERVFTEATKVIKSMEGYLGKVR